MEGKPRHIHSLYEGYFAPELAFILSTNQLLCQRHSSAHYNFSFFPEFCFLSLVNNLFGFFWPYKPALFLNYNIVLYELE